MNVLFEEDGAFRAGAILADNTTSLQVELPSGKRSKVKAASVLLRFAAPAPAELLLRAEAGAEAIEVDFLYEVCAEGEFAFEELAAEYHGGKPDAVQAAAVLLRLHSAPVYFHRKGKGRFRKAPVEILQAALAGLERKKQQAAQVEHMAAELVAGRLPPELTRLRDELLYKPDRNKLETKALEAACAEAGKSAAELLRDCGALPPTHEFHLGRFLFEYFPAGKGGTGFPPYAAPLSIGTQPRDSRLLPREGGRGEGLPDSAAEGLGLPLAEALAFSIDDAATTEIDDAFSLQARPAELGGGWRVGIHIAAPGLGFGPESELGRIARDRLSTVYMPGRKITMLPDAVIAQFTLSAGQTVPAVSLYLDVDADYRVLGDETRLECITVAANLRHHDIEPLFNAETLATGLGDFAWRDELKTLWELAQVLEAGRGKPSDNAGRKDYSYAVDWASPGADGDGLIHITERPRGSPLDVLVAELMIVANATWGAQLRDAGIPALYRIQTAGKVRMGTQAAPHEGLGVDCYAWSSSPLRRYCDLANQWQLIALLRDEKPPFPPKSAELMAALRDFELTYAAYADFQRGMERYWCLRWLLQEQRREVTARVLKEQLVRLEEIPLVLRLLDLPDLATAPRGTRVRIAIDSVDLLAAEARARCLELLPEATSDASFAGEGDEEAGD